MRRTSAAAILVLMCSGALAVTSSASAQPAGQQPTGSLAAALGAEPPAEAATLTFFNRPIVELRARVLGRTPADRARSAVRVLDELIAEGVSGPVEAQPFTEGTVIAVGGRGVIVLTGGDVDELAGETTEAVAAQTATRLRQALGEAAEARDPGRLMRSAAAALFALALAVFALWGERRLRRIAVRRLDAVAERTITRSGLTDAEGLRASRLLDVERGLVSAAGVGIDLLVIYTGLTFVLRQFPYTRPWGESLRGFLVVTVEHLGLRAVNALPGLFTAALVFLATLVLVRMIGFWFRAIEQGRATVRWIYPETAPPTRRLLTTLLWLFAIVVAYPYLPGSQTEAFKGVSVFLGLMVTFGSSGLVNQIMSGFMITYSRALRVGDFVRIGDVEGSVQHLGVLSAKIKSVKNEEITIPNAVVVAQTTNNYSRFGDTEGVYTPTTITIGYDAPWRQVQALLLLAAERTPGIRAEPKPLVLQLSLEDFYVKYALLVCLDRQQARALTLHALHAHIQDLFNEYGVQIMSPNYVLDPAAPKIVPRKDWFAAPAQPDSAAVDPWPARAAVSGDARPGRP